MTFTTILESSSQADLNRLSQSGTIRFVSSRSSS